MPKQMLFERKKYLFRPFYIETLAEPISRNDSFILRTKIISIYTTHKTSIQYHPLQRLKRVIDGCNFLSIAGIHHAIISL